MVTISIIMPVFNTGKYLNDSVGSILRQTYTAFELICVDDASDDESPDILRSLRQQDSRIVVIRHDTNRGAAVSRNDGLEAARGEYVLFLDSDDFFYPDMLETVWRQASENDADVVVFGSETLENGKLRKNAYQSRDIRLPEEKEFFLPKTRHVPWDKLVRRKLLLDHGIRFQDIASNNDILYSFSVMLAAKRILVCDRCLLQYRYRRPGSLTDTRFSGENYTVEAFDALFHFGMQTNLQRGLAVVFMNIIADNIQLHLTGEAYPLKIRRHSLKKLLECESMIDALRRYATEGALYPHNCEFVQKLIKGGDVCGTGYLQYYADSVGKMIRERQRQGKKIALWGCGQNGRLLLQVLEAGNVRVDYVIDESRQLQGEMCGGYQIQPYDAVLDDIAAVLITNLEYKEEIQKRATGKEVLYVWR